jgi:DNA mismatch endonuclease (patch repair protein)
MGYSFKNVTPTRSKTMRAIKGNNTSIEIKLRKALFKSGLRYRVNYKKLPGSPDIVLVSRKIAIFCDSEFWHGKNLAKKKTTIKNNRAYWINKIEENITRDRKNNKELMKMGWSVLRFWESEINGNVQKAVNKILSKLTPTL